MFLVGSFVGIFLAWAKHITRERPVGERYQVVMFCALLLLQYPFVFAMERGNTDTVNVLLYTVAAVLFAAAGSCWPASRPGSRRVSSCHRSSRSR